MDKKLDEKSINKYVKKIEKRQKVKKWSKKRHTLCPEGEQILFQKCLFFDAVPFFWHGAFFLTKNWKRTVKKQAHRVYVLFMHFVCIFYACLWKKKGTLRPDLIESASKNVSANADTIKTHHNDSPMARQYREAGRLVEPLKDFHKDEVRKLGLRQSLKKTIVFHSCFFRKFWKFSKFHKKF